jgi:hypothetical protein
LFDCCKRARGNSRLRETGAFRIWTMLTLRPVLVNPDQWPVIVSLVRLIVTVIPQLIVAHIPEDYGEQVGTASAAHKAISGFSVLRQHVAWLEPVQDA